ncbi:hypothetical protein KJ854_02665 [Patescibacteria group bacterium]|nr:hypothetical protein [Patescibacteria group bacterium]
MEEIKIGDKQKAREERMKLKREFLKSAECSKCHNPISELLQSSDFEPRTINGKQVCKDCWIEDLGEEIEKHPIGFFPGRIRQGGKKMEEKKPIKPKEGSCGECRGGGCSPMQKPDCPANSPDFPANVLELYEKLLNKSHER